MPLPLVIKFATQVMVRAWAEQVGRFWSFWYA